VEERSLQEVLNALAANPKFARVVQIAPEYLESTAEEVPDDD
jgi:hypothetical protein